MRCRNNKNIYINVHHINILQYYIIKNTNANPLKPKVMKLTYIRKTLFNINGIVIYYEFAIPLNIFLMNSNH